jgi:hypothetical protein
VFGNRGPGRRVYTYRHDTSGEDCWAKKEAHVIHVDVEGCRGKTCSVKEFE